MTSYLFLRGFNKNSWVKITSCLAGAATSEGARLFFFCLSSLYHDTACVEWNKERSFDRSMTCFSIFL
jgi:hypothetical protein